MMNSAQYAVRFDAQCMTETKPRWLALASWVLAFFPMAITASALGQALPAAEASPISTGFALPQIAGSFNYALTASENLTWGYYANQGAYAATYVNGDAAFLSGSKLYPFSMVVSGGYSLATSSEPSFGFMNLALSQVVNLKRWEIVASDSVSYLPSTPTGGLSGIPGVGDLGVELGPSQIQGVLTGYSERVTNGSSASLQRQITGKTTASAFGSYSIVRFIGDNGGLNNDSVAGGGTVSHQVNARNSFGVTYAYTKFTYPSYAPLVISGSTAANISPKVSSQTASGQFSHRFTAKLSVSASVGPQWTTINTAANANTLSLYASASASYQRPHSSISVFYFRGANAGYGVATGSVSQGGGVSYGRTLARVWNFTATGSYAQTTELPLPTVPGFSFDTTAVASQVSRAIVRSVSIYTSFTFQHQLSSGTGTTDSFNGNVEVLGFGATYSPPSFHVGRQ